jgi:flagellar hook-associated protein 1 FlgK
MSGSIFNIGVTGVNAAQAGLLVTGHNIANAATEGFHRQQAVQGTQVPQETGAGFFGKGVTVDTVRRAYNQFLENAMLQAQTQGAYLDTYDAQIRQLDNLLADPTAGLSPALQSFFSGVQDVASNPASVPSRQQLISRAQALVNRFQSVDARLVEINDGVNRQLTDVASEINALAQNIARMNLEVMRYQTTDTRPANDLLDKREAMIAQLNTLVRASTVTQSDGSVSVFIGNGQSLVLGGQAFSLAAAPSAEDPQQYGIFYVANGNQVPLGPATLQGGKLGGLLAFRGEALTEARNQIGRVAIALAQTFNDQHRLGQDLAGALGQDFFQVPAAAVLDNANNTGTAVIAATNVDVNALTASDYRLQFNGGTWTLTRLSDNTQTTFAAFPQTVDGVTISLTSGAAANGDLFLIQPTRLGARDIDTLIGDPSKIAAAAPIRSALDTANTGKATISAGVVIDTTNAAFATPGALTPPILIQFTAANQYSVFDNTNPAAPVLLEAGIAYNPAAVNDVFPTPGALDYGYRITLTGAAAAGDRFTVGANPGGVSDNRNALLLAALQTRMTIGSGTANYQSAYSQLVSTVGNRSREIEVQSQAQDSLVAQTREAQQSLSGVNLDEEAANLVRYQQAYQASGRVLQVAAQLFDTILEIGR